MVVQGFLEFISAPMIHAKLQSKSLQEKFKSLLEMGTHKNLDTEFHNKIWAEEQRKLWEAQKLIIDQLESSKGRAEAAFEEVKQVLFEECNIILSNVSTFDPSVEEVD
ncbi:hypothetical protein GLOIN_2v1773341 [Rhizophagus irregularis DAOM 181602=DAOM 197198]|uniref:Uncharacterized protein n=2 Tax=Rhizophagus irregularis TaxID=588596 RepID=A0A2P4Q4Y3_RHIID|nr:hypothetical protein GLOIN_2v1773341 [Rhizophagus irregularis DAOM 181602=DAOM 197198]PKY33204.1 hypothetical protein RhiirB3_451932 [Rhizophagus irregularis]POG72700.1 hypothetical protein GLOIN_2v1773341 [Rhizophagus irregularis DAOM 181602=DAOM 197198]CAG8661818.1 2245_t:CDS:2 [Rhizophagus irregularis]|eukprot:XP_025179566.1 hypothetical protein GLOIN_2v1773341 [Rhizophagus irregularis DAOM 181602=DAOM 197198]